MNAVVGTVVSGVAGGQGQKFARLVGESTKAELVGVVEAHDVDTARELARRYGTPGCRVFGTIEEAIAKLSFTLGICATRPEHHERETLALLAADRHVHCEKPPTATLAGMRRVVRAEAQSQGLVTYNFHLDVQSALVGGKVVNGEFGVPRIVTSQWLRCRLAPAEAEAQRIGGLRRGQPTANPMDDLCHTLRWSLKFLPPGCRIERVLGHSWGNLESLDATVRFPWGDGFEKAQVITVTGWDLPVPGLNTRDLASGVLQGSEGHASQTFLLDDTLPVGAVVPMEHYARLVRVESDGALTEALVKSPQPPTPFECMRGKLDEVLTRILAGERTAEPADAGLQIQVLLDALRRSELEDREVPVEPEDMGA